MCNQTISDMLHEILLNYQIILYYQQGSKSLKCQTKIAADDILDFYFYLLKKIRLDCSCESSA